VSIIDGTGQVGHLQYVPVPPSTFQHFSRASNRGFARSDRPVGRDVSDTVPMSDLWDDDDIDDDDISPICPACGVSALPPEAPGEASMCENPNCSTFGEMMDR